MPTNIAAITAAATARRYSGPHPGLLDRSGAGCGEVRVDAQARRRREGALLLGSQGWCVCRR